MDCPLVPGHASGRRSCTKASAFTRRYRGGFAMALGLAIGLGWCRGFLLGGAEGAGGGGRVPDVHRAAARERPGRRCLGDRGGREHRRGLLPRRQRCVGRPDPPGGRPDVRVGDSPTRYPAPIAARGGVRGNPAAERPPKVAQRAGGWAREWRPGPRTAAGPRAASAALSGADTDGALQVTASTQIRPAMSTPTAISRSRTTERAVPLVLPGLAVLAAAGRTGAGGAERGGRRWCRRWPRMSGGDGRGPGERPGGVERSVARPRGLGVLQAGTRLGGPGRGRTVLDRLGDLGGREPRVAAADERGDPDGERGRHVAGGQCLVPAAGRGHGEADRRPRRRESGAGRPPGRLRRGRLARRRHRCW